jgi:hypothetical protein
MYVSQLYEYRTMISDVEAKEIPLAVSALWSVYRDVGCTDAVATTTPVH